MKQIYSIKALAVLAILIPTLLSAEQSKADLAKAAQNPVANMISLPFQNNYNTGIGSNDEYQNVLNIQPVLPIHLNKDWNIITRTIFPIVSQPDALTNKGRVNGLGDTSLSAFLSPASPGDVTWGVGPAALLPTATDKTLGSDKWAAGPSVVALTMPGNWVVGSLFSNVWSFAGSGEKDINLFTWQYFINYNLEDAWYLTSAPIITADWEEKSSERWTVPVGGGVGKLFKLFDQHINAQVSAYNNVVTPRGGADWQFRVQFQLLFPD